MRNILRRRRRPTLNQTRSLLMQTSFCLAKWRRSTYLRRVAYKEEPNQTDRKEHPALFVLKNRIGLIIIQSNGITWHRMNRYLTTDRLLTTYLVIIIITSLFSSSRTVDGDYLYLHVCTYIHTRYSHALLGFAIILDSFVHCPRLPIN